MAIPHLSSIPDPEPTSFLFEDTNICHSPIPSCSPSPSCSLRSPPSIDNADFSPIPDDQTIVHHPPFNLPGLGIVINLHFRSIICLACERAIDCSVLLDHLHKDLPCTDVPEGLPSVLQSTYDLLPYSSVIYGVGPIPPVFGIPLKEDPMYFCDCGKGYTTYQTLKTHQTRKEGRPCPLRLRRPGFHMGYAQRLTHHRPYFEVDIDTWRLAYDDDTIYPQVYRQSLPPLRQYAQMEIKGAEDEMNTSSFFFTQRWLGHLEGYTTEDILEACKDSTPEVSFGQRLREISEEFLRRSNTAIKRHNSFGLLKLLGQTTERETLHRFDSVSDGTVKKYAMTLHRLVFGVLRQIDISYSHKYRYPPLHSSQFINMKALKDGLDHDLSMDDHVVLFQAACFSLFAHHQHKYTTSKNLDQFFSPVICFLVVSSVQVKGGFKLASVITQTIAHIMFLIRAVMLEELTRKANEEEMGYSEAYTLFKQYLVSGYETPMAYYYNVLTLLATIRSDEGNEARFSCTDEAGREFSYEGNIIKVDNITKMIRALHQRYLSQERKFCFFDEPRPQTLWVEVNIEDIVDNLQNTQPGYSFLDDPRNPFTGYRSSYGEWLLSDPQRAATFVYVHNGQLIWKPMACVNLLRQMKDIRQVLLLLCIFTAGPSSRATEVTRQLLRNVPGSYRNLLVLFHIVCLVDIQDKTSHKHLKDKYVPHCPSHDVASLLIQNLAIFRPFEEHLVQVLLGAEHGLRYHQQLWPDLTETISDTCLSDLIGKECSLHLTTPLSIGKVSYKILFWRNLVTAILKHQPNIKTIATHQQYYIDTAMMHSSGMAVARYGGESSHLPLSDPRQVVECIKVGLEWHKLLKIKQKKPLSVDIDKQLEVLESSNPLATASTNAQLSSATISSITNQITELVGSRLETMLQETIMKNMAEMSHLHFPKIIPNITNDLLVLTDIDVPPSRLRDLRHFLKNPSAQFSCAEQAVLLELMIRRSQSVLAVLGTGSGKTMVVLMQASLQKSLVTIVILPLSSLHGDLQRRATQLGVSYSRWKPSGKFNPNVNIISVSIEHLGFKDFIAFISELEHQRRLGPLVFDEIHKMITDSAYRDAFYNFHALHCVTGVVFGLTGSLPPTLYPALCELTGMTWKVMRTPSSRKELKYQVVSMKSDEDMDLAITAYLQSAILTYRPNERAMVFCRTKAQAHNLATLLKVKVYHAVLEEEMPKNDETMKRWLSGDNLVMVSTSILGCGLNYKYIRDVIHRDPSYTMLDQYQEDSRGGRDGLECRATTFIVDNKEYPLPANQYDLGTKALIDSMHERTACLRMAPTLYLDGQAIRCIALPGAIFCGNCDKRSSTISPQAVHSIPRRVPDIFDPSPRVDIRALLRPERDPGNQTTPKSMDPSPNKKRKLTPCPMLEISSPLVGTDVVSPTSIMVAQFTSSSLPAQSSYNSIVIPRRVIQPAGILPRQHQLIAAQTRSDYENMAMAPLFRSIIILSDKCVMCWMYKKLEWVTHESDKCRDRIGTNNGDPDYSKFRSSAITLPVGWCYGCFLPQMYDTPELIGHAIACGEGF